MKVLNIELYIMNPSFSNVWIQGNNHRLSFGIDLWLNGIQIQLGIISIEIFLKSY